MQSSEKNITADKGNIDNIRCFLTALAPKIADWKTLSSGPHRFRPVPGAARPLFAHFSVKRPAVNVINSVRRWGIGECWQFDPGRIAVEIGEGDQSYPGRAEIDFNAYLDTGEPIFLETQHPELLACTPDLQMLNSMIDRLEARGVFFTIMVMEWENYLEWDPVKIFGRATEDMPREAVWKLVFDKFREWHNLVRGHITSQNGYGLLAHLGAEAGEDMVGIETGECIPGTQVQRAFARGAARQFDLPLYDHISPWFFDSVPTGADELPRYKHDSEMGFPYAHDGGHSVSMMDRLLVSAWVGGASVVIPEGATWFFFNVSVGASAMPESQDVYLSEHGRRALELISLMKEVDIGTPYTPFGVIISKYHGHAGWWGHPSEKVWGRLPRTRSDDAITEFFDKIFTGYAKGRGNEERYLCPSPYGDTFDVLVNAAERSAWDAYPVLIAVGAPGWTAEDIDYLKSYVERGGVLCLGSMSIDGWDRKWLGLEDDRFAPLAGTTTLSSGNGSNVDNTAKVLGRQIGKGAVIISPTDQIPTEILETLAQTYLPVRVTGNVEWMLNRTSTGWVLMVLNNTGISKPDKMKRAVVDYSASEHFHVSLPESIASCTDIVERCDIVLRNDDGLHFEAFLNPGEWKLYILEEFTSMNESQ